MLGAGQYAAHVPLAVLTSGREVLVVGVSQKAEANLSRLGTLEFLDKSRILPSMNVAMDRADEVLHGTVA